MILMKIMWQNLPSKIYFFVMRFIDFVLFIENISTRLRMIVSRLDKQNRNDVHIVFYHFNPMLLFVIPCTLKKEFI